MIALGIEYDGSRYVGWQRQKNGLGVQQVVEEALSSIADGPVRVSCAGRTDRGVHALEQVVSFSPTHERSPTAWVRGTNSLLPADVRVRWMRTVGESFNARFSALQRHYRYLIYNSPVASALFNTRVTHQPRRLSEKMMADAGKSLLGTHDFTSYRATACQAHSPVRTISKLAVFRSDDLISVDVSADGFLHHMVRNIVGVLMAIGVGDQPVTWAAEVLAAKNRALGGVTALPNGLYLVGVDYPAWKAQPVSLLPINGALGR